MVIQACVLALSVSGRRAQAVPPGGCGDITYYGGQVISNIQVVQVSWTNDVPSSLSLLLFGFYNTVLSSPYLDWLYEYDTPTQFIGEGYLAATQTITPSVTGTSLTDVQIAAELVQQMEAGRLAEPMLDQSGNVRTFYAVEFPSGYTISSPGGTTCETFCAYNGTMTYNGHDVSYGVFPDVTSGGCAATCGTGTATDNITTVHSHVILNAITDPGVGLAPSVLGPPVAWYSNDCGGIADICNQQPGQVSGYAVEKGWSKRLQACIATASDVPPPCTGADTPAGCRGCTVFDDGAGCHGATPVCDSRPTSSSYGRCIPASPLDAGADGSSIDGPARNDGGMLSGCAPGQEATCVCMEGGAGAQACMDSGAGYGACECPDAGRMSSGAGSCGCAVDTTANSTFAAFLIGGAALASAFRRRRRSSRACRDQIPPCSGGIAPAPMHTLHTT